MNTIMVNKINMWYGRFQALKDVSFYIPEGSVAGLVGPNGAGKTTLIKTIIGILPYSGQIQISKSSDRSSIGYLAEDEGYYTYMTGYEYLQYFGKIYEIKNLNLKINKILEIVGLKGKENTVIKKYSKGMKRRLGIARTLIFNPNIIILDEPMSGLDPKIKLELRNLISGISEKRTFLISSHQLRDIEDICDWIVMIKEGKIVDFGKPEEILNKLNPQRIITIQTDGPAQNIIKRIKGLSGVSAIEYKNNILKITYEGSDDSEIFKFFISSKIKFTVKSDTLESIYREVYK